MPCSPTKSLSGSADRALPNTSRTDTLRQLRALPSSHQGRKMLLKTLIEKVPDDKKRNLLLTGGGMLALLAGRKIEAATMFARGMQGLEKQWRENHPEFTGGARERWQLAEDFYESTHKNDTNRILHIVGIPVIVGGTIGLLAFKPFRPLWIVSAGAFAGGWALNFVGHALYEKSAPAFADDPLSFVAGPVWDLKQVVRRKKSVEA